MAPAAASAAAGAAAGGGRSLGLRSARRAGRRETLRAGLRARRAEAAAVVEAPGTVWRINLLDGAGRTLEARCPFTYGRRRLFRGLLQASGTLDPKTLAARALPEVNVTLSPPTTVQQLLPSTVMRPTSPAVNLTPSQRPVCLPSNGINVPVSVAGTTSASSGLVEEAIAVRSVDHLPVSTEAQAGKAIDRSGALLERDHPAVPREELVRRLRRMPLRRLAHAVFELREASVGGKGEVWAALAPRLLANTRNLPAHAVACALAALRRHGCLTSNAIVQSLRGLARHAWSPSCAPGFDMAGNHQALRECCRILSTSWPAAAYGDGLFRNLTSTLVSAPSANLTLEDLLSWAELYADLTLVDSCHLLFWERMASTIERATLAPRQCILAGNLQNRVPLWIAECFSALPPEDRFSFALTGQDASLTASVAGEKTCAEAERESVGDLAAVAAAHALTVPGERRPPTPEALRSPVYQTYPPVPVLWHVSPENCRRGLARLGARQLALALEYTAADRAGLARRAAPPAGSRGSWPPWHRNQSRAQAFVRTLLGFIAERCEGLPLGVACGAVRSLASLRRAGLARGPEASAALDGLLQRLAGWQVSASLAPCDVTELLEGLAMLTEGGGASAVADADPEDLDDGLIVTTRSALDGRFVTRVVRLAACALQEALAPSNFLLRLCYSVRQLLRYPAQANGEGRSGLEDLVERRRAIAAFLRAAAAQTAGRPRARGQTAARRFSEPIEVLRVAAGAGAWNSQAYAMLAPSVAAAALDSDARHSEELREIARHYARVRLGSRAMSVDTGYRFAELGKVLVATLPELARALPASELVAYAGDLCALLRSAAAGASAAGAVGAAGAGAPAAPAASRAAAAGGGRPQAIASTSTPAPGAPGVAALAREGGPPVPCSVRRLDPVAMAKADALARFLRDWAAADAAVAAARAAGAAGGAGSAGVRGARRRRAAAADARAEANRLHQDQEVLAICGAFGALRGPLPWAPGGDGAPSAAKEGWRRCGTQRQLLAAAFLSAPSGSSAVVGARARAWLRAAAAAGRAEGKRQEAAAASRLVLAEEEAP